VPSDIITDVMSRVVRPIITVIIKFVLILTVNKIVQIG